jgi:glycerate kinase
MGMSTTGTFGGMRVLVAPDKFRGTLSARQAAEAIETGWRRSQPADDLDLAPMADGGEGTLEALVDARGGRIVPASVTGPLGDPVDAAFGLVETSDGLTGVVESARASGLALLGEERRDPLRATTRGTGELILATIEAGARRVVVCLGGSATNDGGVGMAAALGIRFLDAQGRELADGGAALLHLARIDASDLHPGVAGASFLGATDVENPLCGPSGASHVYGPQKGASPDDVFLLDRALAHLAAIVHHDLGIALKDEPGAGAAGGLGFGLLAFCGAGLRRGVDVVMEAVDLGGRMEGADLVITGEGSLDAQSLYGKVPAGVIRLAALLSVPVAVLCGRSEVKPEGVTVRSLVDRVGEEAALGDARRSLELLASELATDLPPGVAR